jgi:hypothetical protein
VKLRIAIWAVVGLPLAVGWVLYSSSAFPSPLTQAKPAIGLGIDRFFNV